MISPRSAGSGISRIWWLSALVR